jgi:hypothetical protein
MVAERHTVQTGLNMVKTKTEENIENHDEFL